MADQTDPLGFKIVGSSNTAATPPSAIGKDPLGFDIVGGGSSAPQPSSAQASPAPTESGTDALGFKVLGGSSAPATSPDNGQPDPNEGIWAKSWRAINTPLTESLLGWKPTDTPGALRGAETIGAGLTSPLSIALTLATFGTAGFLESAGASVLKDTLGMSAEQIAQIGKGAEITADAMKTGNIGAGKLDLALKAADIDPAVYHGAMDTLYKAGLKEADLTSGDLVTRGVSQIARKVGLTPLQSQNVAKGFQTLASAGFAGQAAYTAATMSPRVLDALKDGDYQHAAEYATEAAASGLFAVAGATHALRSAGDLVDPVNGTKLRPVDEHANFKKAVDASPDKEVKVVIRRGNDAETQTISIKPMPRPTSAPAK